MLIAYQSYPGFNYIGYLVGFLKTNYSKKIYISLPDLGLRLSFKHLSKVPSGALI